ncbi:MAG: hypothetical protein OSB43_19485, partial [Nocardioides sp.]|uniref:hypothetical protein n=1 Tax=Nocardioides sp. TaxID=35761 RepID=UPI002398F1B7
AFGVVGSGAENAQQALERVGVAGGAQVGADLTGTRFHRRRRRRRPAPSAQGQVVDDLFAGC